MIMGVYGVIWWYYGGFLGVYGDYRGIWGSMECHLGVYEGV